MNKYEADKLIKRMQAVFTFTNFADEGVKVEWVKSIGSLDYSKCDKLIDQYKKTDSKALPPISAFVQEYWRYENRSKEVVNCNCPKCGGKGFLAYRRKYEYKNCEQLTEPFIAFCDCAAGEQYKYNGTQCSDRKTDYYIPSADQLQLVEEKFPENIGIDEIKRQTYRFLGIRMNIYPHGDAYEPQTERAPWER